MATRPTKPYVRPIKQEQRRKKSYDLAEDGEELIGNLEAIIEEAIRLCEAREHPRNIAEHLRQSRADLGYARAAFSSISKMMLQAKIGVIPKDEEATG